MPYHSISLITFHRFFIFFALTFAALRSVRSRVAVFLQLPSSVVWTPRQTFLLESIVRTPVSPSSLSLCQPTRPRPCALLRKSRPAVGFFPNLVASELPFLFFFLSAHHLYILSMCLCDKVEARTSVAFEFSLKKIDPFPFPLPRLGLFPLLFARPFSFGHLECRSGRSVSLFVSA